MPIGILNNIAGLSAENQLSITNSSLQNVLYQLSSGSRINTGADDAAGLAIANGLQANISALTQSANNANDGIGALQVADGSLAQVTTLLNRAVTLATESANGSVSSTQRQALDAEYQQIQTEINRIGSNTNFNGTQVFTATPTSVYITDGTGNTSQASNFITANVGTLSATGLLGASATSQLNFDALPSAGDTVAIGGVTYTFADASVTTGSATARAAGDQLGATDGATANTVLIDNNANASIALAKTIANLAAAVNGGAGAGTSYGTGTAVNTYATATAGSSSVTFTATAAAMTELAAGDDATSNPELGGTYGGTVGTAGAFLNQFNDTYVSGATSDLLSATDAQTALSSINNAIQTVAATRGQIGAVINRLQSASNVISNQVTNLTSAENTITAADIPTAVANLTKYSILEQTGISALAQANQQQQLVLKLLQ
ncbi:MAG TPA: flagellin [Verrucomicrobiae bacterium]|nr:flagellin [Verrucomicrobiae bacterium]